MLSTGHHKVQDSFLKQYAYVRNVNSVPKKGGKCMIMCCLFHHQQIQISSRSPLDKVREVSSCIQVQKQNPGSLMVMLVSSSHPKSTK